MASTMFDYGVFVNHGAFIKSISDLILFHLHFAAFNIFYVLYKIEVYFLKLKYEVQQKNR